MDEECFQTLIQQSSSVNLEYLLTNAIQTLKIWKVDFYSITNDNFNVWKARHNIRKKKSDFLVLEVLLDWCLRVRTKISFEVKRTNQSILGNGVGGGEINWRITLSSMTLGFFIFSENTKIF